MARKKQEEPDSIEGGWINTFADLMNLLLCFFVLLFSMSTVDADKYEQIVASFSERINIFDGGGDAVGEGAFVSSGTSQKISMEQYFNEFEQSSMKEQEENTSSDQTGEEEWEAKKLADLKDKTETIYEEVTQLAADKDIQDEINVSTDQKYQYVQISLNGAILFDSGEDAIKSSALGILSKVGDILKVYDNHMIKIEGHTDNVQISGGRFPNNMWLSTARAARVYDYFVDKKKLTAETLEATGRGECHPVASNDNEKGRAKNRRVEIKIYTENN